jgi:hypothetical protein
MERDTRHLTQVSAVEAKLKGYTTYAQLLGDIRRDNRGKL